MDVDESKELSVNISASFDEIVDVLIDSMEPNESAAVEDSLKSVAVD